MSLKIEVWTDGACSGNPGPMGAGIVLKSNKGHYKELSIPLGEGTNNIAELLAVKIALETIKAKGADIVIYTDSQYVVGIFEWGWNARANIDLIEEIKKIKSLYKSIKFTQVSGHSGNEMNDRADSLAKKACKQI